MAGSSMASSDGVRVQKKKRAWRKPREAVGPGVLQETTSESKPQKLARFSHREPEHKNDSPITASQKDDEAMDISETQASGGASGEKESSSGNGMRNWDETREGGLEQRHEEGGGAALSGSLPSESPLAPAATVVEIDGSVLEGVSH